MEAALHAYRWGAEALIVRCQELGVRQVCLALACMPGVAETGVPDRQALRDFVRRLADAGITLAVGNGSSGRDPELLLHPEHHRRALDDQRRTIAALGYAGISAFLYYLHFPQPVDPDDDARYWEGLVRNVQVLVAEAEASNVRLAHHAIWRCLPPPLRETALRAGLTADGYRGYRTAAWDGPYLLTSHADVARLLDAVPSSHNGVCFCTGMQIMGGNVPALVETFRGKIHYAQIRDVRGCWPGAEEVFLGEGEVDFRATLRALDRVGYRGGLGPEHLGTPRWPGDDPEAAAVAFVQRELAALAAERATSQV